MKRRTPKPLLGQILQKIAPRIGAKVLQEPEWGIVGQITYKNGRRRYYRYSTLDMNPVGASDIAKDKDFANFFMKKMGYPTIEGKTFFSKEWAKTIGSKRTIDAAYRYAVSLGLPVIVKPNSGSQGGNVALVHTKRDFFAALRAIFKRDRVALVQRVVSGIDYRIVVLDNKVISAYERIPLSVRGDGRATIRQLLKRKQQAFLETGRDTQLRTDDPRITRKLARKGMTLSSVPARDQTVFLLDNANLSTGGDSIDVTKSIHPKIKKIAIALTKDMGLRLCGVDLMIDGRISEEPKTYWVLEINAAPGLDHYARSGQEQQRIVESLYLTVLKSMQ